MDKSDLRTFRTRKKYLIHMLDNFDKLTYNELTEIQVLLTDAKAEALTRQLDGRYYKGLELAEPLHQRYTETKE